MRFPPNAPQCGVDRRPPAPHIPQGTAQVALLSTLRFTLAYPTPRCCRLGQCEWVPDLESALGASSGGRRAILNILNFNIARRHRPIGSQTCTTQLRVVINKTPSPYQTGSRTILYDSLVPTDANVRIVRHLANVNGVPTRRRMVSSRFASDYIGGQSGHRIG